MTKTYFDLKKLRSYMVKTKHNKYHFKKGTPLPVENQEDIDRFKSEYEILFETNKNGEAVLEEEIGRVQSRGYSRFRESTLPGDMDHETLLKKAYEETSRARQAGVDVDSLLNQVKSDIVENGLKKEETGVGGKVVDETITSFDVTPEDASTKKKPSKKKVAKEDAAETQKEIEQEKEKEEKRQKKRKS